MTAYSHLAEVAGEMIEPLGTVVDGRELADIRPIGAARRRADLLRLVREMGAVLLLAATAIDLAASSWADVDTVPSATRVALDALECLADAIARGDHASARRLVECLAAGWSAYRPAHGWHPHAAARLAAIGEWLMSSTDVARSAVTS